MIDSVKLNSISQNYGEVQALININLEIKDGEFFSLLGPSGSGKTTCLRIIAGFEPPNEGTVFLFNENVTTIPPYKRRVNTVFQDYALFPHMTVEHNVGYSLKIKGVSLEEYRKQVHEILHVVKLEGYTERKINQLSGGQKQLVAIARSLITKPKLLMMDEPFANLDQRLKNKIRDITLHLLQKTFTTALIVTHDPDDAMFMGDFIAVMNKGKILQFDTPVNIYNKPNSAFVARFFGETLSLRSKVNNRKVKTIFGPIKVTDSKSIKAKEIEIIFRSEAFSITKSNPKKIQGKIKSKIIAVKYISENSYLHLDILNNSVQKHLHIKVPGKFIPPKNKICYINIGKRNFFIFKYK